MFPEKRSCFHITVIFFDFISNILIKVHVSIWQIFFDFVLKNILKKKSSSCFLLTAFLWFFNKISWNDFMVPYNCDFLWVCFKKYPGKSSCFHITEIFFDFVSKNILKKLGWLHSLPSSFHLTDYLLFFSFKKEPEKNGVFFPN